MIGHMVLQRTVDGEDVLGLKVRGGQVLPSDDKAAASTTAAAIVEQVQRGLIADQEGHIRPGNYPVLGTPGSGVRTCVSVCVGLWHLTLAVFRECWASFFWGLGFKARATCLRCHSTPPDHSLQLPISFQFEHVFR